MDQATEWIKVLTTIGDEDEARTIAQVLVEKNMAACVQVIGPIHSVYRWQGQVESSAEWLLMIKTSVALMETVEAEILHHHSYEVPEIIVLPIVAGAKRYLDWLDGELGSSPHLKPNES